MKKLEYSVLKKESSENCNYCLIYARYGDDITLTPSSYEIIAYDEEDKCVDIACLCNNCKKDFDNRTLPYCDDCGRLKRRREYCICDRLDKKNGLGGTSKPIEARLAKKTKELEKELKTAKKELKVEREEVAKFQKKSEEWSKKQKQELIKENERLKERVKQLEKQTQQTAQIETPAKDKGIKGFFKLGGKK